ncbi:hypothetical protein ACVWZL_008650 [Bradyrhizobium sp. GM2.4]
MTVDRGFGHLVAFFHDDHGRALGAQAVLGALEVVFAEIVVLIEDRDLGVRLFLQQPFRVDLRFALVGRLPAHGPGEVLRVIPLGGAGGDEQLRDLLGVEVFLDRAVRGRAERVEHDDHLVALDQLADLLDGLRRRIAVVIGDEVDLAAVDAALVVDHLEVGFFGLADDAIGRGRTAIRHDVADLDLGIGRAGVIFFLGECGAGGESDDRRCRHQRSGSQCSFKKQFGSP